VYIGTTTIAACVNGGFLGEPGLAACFLLGFLLTYIPEENLWA